jgi:hypothetical protein
MAVPIKETGQQRDDVASGHPQDPVRDPFSVAQMTVIESKLIKQLV